MSQNLKKWREEWNNGDVKFVPELFEMAENLQKKNARLNEELGRTAGRMDSLSDELKRLSRHLFNV